MRSSKSANTEPQLQEGGFATMVAFRLPSTLEGA